VQTGSHVCELNVAASGQKVLTYSYWLAPVSNGCKILEASENVQQLPMDARYWKQVILFN
jgi:hypothetical protein